jgi:hypothetical protein
LAGLSPAYAALAMMERSTGILTAAIDLLSSAHVSNLSENLSLQLHLLASNGNGGSLFLLWK